MSFTLRLLSRCVRSPIQLDPFNLELSLHLLMLTKDIGIGLSVEAGSFRKNNNGTASSTKSSY